MMRDTLLGNRPPNIHAAGPSSSGGSRQLTAAQSRRRVIRQKLAEAAGLVKPGEVFHAYGPNKTAGADKLMQSGTGLGQGLGAAQRAAPKNLVAFNQSGSQQLQLAHQQAVAQQRAAQLSTQQRNLMASRRRKGGTAGGKPIV